MRRWIVACGSAACLFAAPAAAAAAAVDIEVSGAERCLQVQPGAPQLPEYPHFELEVRKPGSVRVELTFRESDRAPAVRVLAAEAAGGDADAAERFVQAVSVHARALRVPCLDAREAPLRIVRRFAFDASRPGLAVAASSVPDLERSDALFRCLAHESGDLTPPYPEVARRQAVQGRVLLRLSFVAADRPPEIEAFSRPNARVLARYLQQWALGLRVPCLGAGTEFRFVRTHVYVFKGGTYGLGPMLLPQLMSMTKGIHAQRLQFDTTTMGCPFDLRFDYRQPGLPNWVGQLGEYREERESLLEWIRGVEFALDGPQLDAVYGASTIVTVPCVRIDLKPKE